MCKLKREICKAGIALAGMLLLLVLMVWVPASAVGAPERASELVTTGAATVQATPTEDATVTALNKEKLEQEVQQLKNQNALDLFGWLRTNAAVLVVVIGGLIGLWRWFGDRRSEREKRAEERFQAVVEGLGSKREETKVGAAITLRTFLRPGYEQFYIPTFDLAVAHLRLPRTSHPSEDPDGIPQSPIDPNTPLPLTTLRQALIGVFKEAFPPARERIKKRRPLGSSFLLLQWIITSPTRTEVLSAPLSPLDVAGIQLDNAYLKEADLKRVWMPEAFLRQANLSGADLFGADLFGADLSRANLSRATLWWTNLSEAKLLGADLSRAKLLGADLSRAKLLGADLSKANLTGVDLSGANLSGANLSGTDLSESAWMIRGGWGDKGSGANLSGANLSGANFSGANLSGANLTETDLTQVRNLEQARSLEHTNLCGAKGLTKEQLEACKAKGAIIDEDSTTTTSGSPSFWVKVKEWYQRLCAWRVQSALTFRPKPPGRMESPTSPPQSSVSPSPSKPCNDAQAPSAQVNTPTPGTGESSATPPSQSGS